MDYPVRKLVCVPVKFLPGIRPKKYETLSLIFTTQQGTRNIAPPLLRGNAGGLYDYEGELDEFDAYSGQPYAFDDYQGQSYVSGAYRGQPAASGAQRGQPAASGAYRGQPAASGAHRGQPGASGAQRGQPATSGAHKGQPARGRDHPNDLSGIGNLDARFAADPRFSNAPGSFRNLTVPPIKAGDRVRRGPNWRYGNQDGNPPGPGTVTGPDSTPDWWRVIWDSGGENCYCWGEDGKFDLEIISGRR
ncbi:hypothetical protein BaRGS_00033836 [Batillaria attramentaria]|uniref:MIB/HERC2 domain-containing protein n=1 Tax=Batillaria attramentaria TaxID=370345 RepID=A0ABD0JJ46_9CAEN